MDGKSEKQPANGASEEKAGLQTEKVQQGPISGEFKDAMADLPAGQENKPAVSTEEEQIQATEDMKGLSATKEKNEVSSEAHPGHPKAESSEEDPLKAVQESTVTLKAPSTAKEKNQTEAPVPQTKEEKVARILELKGKISTLLANVKDTKTLCEKHENENQYLQDYVATLMQNGELRK